MNPALFRIRSFLGLLPALTCGALAMLGGACSTLDQSGATHFTNVQYYELDLDKEVVTADRMVEFEREHYLHGAVSNEERRAREGNYYTFHWQTSDTASPATVRFEYRQQKTGPAVHVVEVAVDDVREQNRTTVAIVGEAYQSLGPVSSWRVSVMRGGEVAASSQSYLWE